MKKEYAEEVAAKIIEQLQQGTAPWQKPWKPGELSLPRNAATGKEYRGINSMWLAMQGHGDPRWMTYNQANDAGAQVRKGSKGTKIVYWKTHDEEKAKDSNGKPILGEDGKPKMIRVALERPRAFHAVVFNAEQIDGLPPLEPKTIAPEPERHARAEAILANSGATIRHVAGNRAFYSPGTDSITLPERGQFDTADGYYATALHELGHWTGHGSRLDRDLSNPFGSEGYAREELRAEISSLMVGERLEIGHDPGQHAAYVGSWIKALKEDPREIFRAAADAEKISNYVMAFEQEREKMKEQPIAETVLREAASISRGEHPMTADARVDRVRARETFLQEFAKSQPQAAGEVAKAWRDNAGHYSDVSGLSPDSVNAYAGIVERQMALGPAVGPQAGAEEPHYSDKTLQALVENHGWEVAYSGLHAPGQVDSVRRQFDGVGPLGTQQTPYGERNLYAGYNDDAERRRYIALKLGEEQIADMDGRDATPADVARLINLKAEQFADEKRVANGLEPIYAVGSPELTLPREGAAIQQEAFRVSLYDDQRRPPLPPDDPNELRDQANRGELRAIQRSSSIDMVPATDMEIGLRFRDLLRDTAQRGDAIGADASKALDYYANAYGMDKTREEMKTNGATAEDMAAEENAHWLKIGFDIRTGTGSERAMLGEASPTETALMLRALSDRDRPEVMPEPRANDPEAKLRAIWDKEGVPKEKQDALIAEIEAMAKPGARVGPFVIPGGDAAPAPAVRHHPPEKPMPDRTYLAVPYAEKEQAKAAAQAAGFKLQWDKENKAWFAPAGADLSKMEQWKADSSRVQTPTTKSAEDQFADALKGAGLIVDGVPVMDGKIHRVPVEGDRDGELSGAYAGHLTGHLPGGYIQNYKSGEVVNWKAEGTIAQTTPEQRAQLAAEAAERQQKREAETSAKHEATAAAAKALWREAPSATADNAYCKAKGITEPVGLRTVPESIPEDVATAHNIKIAKTVREAKAMRDADPEARVFKTGDLLIPGADMKDGKLWTLQSVNPDFKSFMKGGRKHGVTTLAGIDAERFNSLEKLADQNKPIIVAEGYATANTVAKLADQPVVVAFDSGNLDAVLRELRREFPTRQLLIAADNDHEAETKTGPDGKPRKNVGMEKAHAAAKAHGAGVIAPQFKPGEKGSDWNDRAGDKGEEEARREFDAQMAVAKRDAAINAERLISLAREREQEVRDDPSTSADDAVVASERGKAAGLIASASEQMGNVRAAAAEGKAASRSGRPAAASVKASLDRKNGELQDDTKRERQDVQNNAQSVNSNGSTIVTRQGVVIAEQRRIDIAGEKQDAAAKPKRPRARGIDAGM